ncbi:hypothetical protein C2869_14120 [Saccharobesus litoralis]|uniref:LTD domain-containing protein n=1 Tax=Saccharobesus litoralis TaxID=2172099 RepID=A0A2S0VTH1_9ALTE|nr:lamin tail domain-containing protein [Saccharobesus litoralis]AWB67505.1 hypothetical protein C2869_14120 [Saccharobesus litoralis]
MSNIDFDKKAFVEKLPVNAYAIDVQSSWNFINEYQNKLTQANHQKRIDQSIKGSALSDWWHAAYELMAGRHVVISDVNYSGDTEREEFIEITNKGPEIVDLTGWRINAGDKGQDMQFPSDTWLKPNHSLRVYTFANDDEMSFERKQPIWNNKGDKAWLFNQLGEVICSYVYGEAALSHVAITQICFDGKVKHTEADEYIEIANLDFSFVDLSGWNVNAGIGQDFIFPQGSQLAPNAKIRVYTNLVDEATGGYSFASPRAIWNNKGDTGTLTNYDGKVASTFTYG